MKQMAKMGAPLQLLSLLEVAWKLQIWNFDMVLANENKRVELAIEKTRKENAWVRGEYEKYWSILKNKWQKSESNYEFNLQAMD